MAFFVYLGLFSISLIKSKSKLLADTFLIFLAIVSIFNDTVADISIYETRYYMYESLASISEIGFTYIEHICHAVKLSFFQFRALIIIIFLINVRWFVFKYSSYPSFVIALYSLFSYCIDVVQLRNSLAMIFIIHAMDVLIGSKDRFWILKYFTLVMVATTIHFTSIFYLLLVVARFVNITKVSIIILSSYVSSVLLFSRQNILIKLMSFFISEDRIYIVLDFASRYYFSRIVNYQLGVVFCTVLIVLYLSLVIKRTTLRNKEAKMDFYVLRNIELLSLYILPLMFLSIDIYRIPRNLLWISYVAWLPSVVSLKHSSLIFEEHLNKVLMLAIVVSLFVLQIYGMGNLDSTFGSLFFY